MHFANHITIQKVNPGQPLAPLEDCIQRFLKPFK